MYHLSEGPRPCPFAIMANGHGRVTEPVSLSLDLDLFGDNPLSSADNPHAAKMPGHGDAAYAQLKWGTWEVYEDFKCSFVTE